MQNYRGRNRYTRELYVSEVKAIMIALGVVIALLLTGCDSDRAPRQYDGRMKIIGGDTFTTIYVDKETGVCYLAARQGVTLMVNADGSPFVANGWRDYE